MKFVGLIVILFYSTFSIGQVKRCSPDHDEHLIEQQTGKLNNIYVATVMPQFTGGDIRNYLHTNLPSSIKNGEKTDVTFVVDTNGQIKNVCIISFVIRKELTER